MEPNERMRRPLLRALHLPFHSSICFQGRSHSPLPSSTPGEGAPISWEFYLGIPPCLCPFCLWMGAGFSGGLGEVSF